MLAALQPHEAELRASTHGGALLRRTRFAHWKEHRASWAQHETKAAATRRAFAEFLRDDEPDGEPAPIAHLAICQKWREGKGKGAATATAAVAAVARRGGGPRPLEWAASIS